MAHALTVFTPDAQNKTICHVYTVSLKSLECSSITGLPHENIAVVRTTLGVVSATFGTVSYFALYQYPPLSQHSQILGFQCCSCGGGGCQFFK